LFIASRLRRFGHGQQMDFKMGMLGDVASYVSTSQFWAPAPVS
jgi:hypothetical protein